VVNLPGAAFSRGSGFPQSHGIGAQGFYLFRKFCDHLCKPGGFGGRHPFNGKPIRINAGFFKYNADGR
jgi:hypothetical protein